MEKKMQFKITQKLPQSVEKNVTVNLHNSRDNNFHHVSGKMHDVLNFYFTLSLKPHLRAFNKVILFFTVDDKSAYRPHKKNRKQ